MGFVKFYKTRLSPIVTITALIIGIHISWWSIQQKFVEKKLIFFIIDVCFSSPALVPPSERRRNILGIRLPYLSPPVDDKEEKKTE